MKRQQAFHKLWRRLPELRNIPEHSRGVILHWYRQRVWKAAPFFRRSFVIQWIKCDIHHLSRQGDNCSLASTNNMSTKTHIRQVDLFPCSLLWEKLGARSRNGLVSKNKREICVMSIVNERSGAIFSVEFTASELY